MNGVTRVGGPHLLGLVSSQGDKVPELALPSRPPLAECLQKRGHVRTQWKDRGLQPGTAASPETTPVVPRSRTSSLPRCERMNVCCVSRRVWYFVVSLSGQTHR